MSTAVPDNDALIAVYDRQAPRLRGNGLLARTQRPIAINSSIFTPLIFQLPEAMLGYRCGVRRPCQQA